MKKADRLGIDRKLLPLLLLVSLAHALVHVFELSLASVEQMLAEEFSVDQRVTGWLATTWRIPFGVGALLAGWATDRFGSKPLLLTYLLGCAGAALLVSQLTTLPLIFVCMFAMGCAASIYHPAGLALISHETTPENRGAALGWHGIIGSIGIASAPFIAGTVFRSGDVDWRQYYQLLAIPAVLLAVLIARFQVTSHHRLIAGEDPQRTAGDGENWSMFFRLVASGALCGFIYAAFVGFLPRYLDTVEIPGIQVARESSRNLLAGFVLAFAIAGQAVSGRLARPGQLVILLRSVLVANVPVLLWVAVAEGQMRLLATCVLAFVHFMQQPVYNSLIARFVPRHRRSLGYGFSNMMCFGIGALGPAYAGQMPADEWAFWTYGSLAVLSIVAAGLTWKLRD